MKTEAAHRLQHELRQNRPFTSLGQEAFLGLLRTADVTKQQYVVVMATAGLTFQQYNVLRILRGTGEKGLPTLEIGERMIERTPGVTRIVDRLERKGLVTRDRGVEDRRRVWCRITPKGLEVLAALDEPVRAIDRSLFRNLDEDEVVEFIRLMEVVRTTLMGSVGEEGEDR